LVSKLEFSAHEAANHVYRIERQDGNRSGARKNDVVGSTFRIHTTAGPSEAWARNVDTSRKPVRGYLSFEVVLYRGDHDLRFVLGHPRKYRQ
jgi:hypothetical protein